MNKSRVKKHKQKRSRKNDGSKSPTFKHKLWANKAAHKASLKRFSRSSKRLAHHKLSPSKRSPRGNSLIYSPNKQNIPAILKKHVEQFKNMTVLNKSRNKIINNRILGSTLPKFGVDEINKYL